MTQIFYNEFVMGKNVVSFKSLTLLIYDLWFSLIAKSNIKHKDENILSMNKKQIIPALFQH